MRFPAVVVPKSPLWLIMKPKVIQVRAMHSFYNDANSIKDAAIDPAILDHGFENIFYAYNPKKPHQNIPYSAGKKE